MRVGLRSIVLVAVLGAGCASGDGESTTPTAPTAPTPPPAAPPPPSSPPPSNSCLPGAASNLSSTLVNSTRTLTWTAGANATAYDVYIGSTPGSSNLVRDRTTHTNYTWTGIPGATDTFYATVHSHNSCGSGPPSPELVFH
jgi:hypothetical protein